MEEAGSYSARIVIENDTDRPRLVFSQLRSGLGRPPLSELWGTNMGIDQEERTNRRWLIVSLYAWGLISALVFVRMCVVGGFAEFTLAIYFALVGGAILTFIAVSLPFRVFQNLAQPERRRVRLWETVWCILAFLALVNVVILMIISRPPDW